MYIQAITNTGGTMVSELITLDDSAQYATKEVAILVVAAAFVIALAGVAAAAYIICGWKGAKYVVMDFVHGKATFVCR